jgi:hypothetical protein
MSLLADLLKLGDSAVPSELPSESQIGRVVGSIVKVLEHEGLAVADGLFPSATDTVASVAAAADPSITAEATAKLEDLVDRIERAAAKVTGHPVAPDPATEPVAPPSPAAGFFTPSVQSPPSSSSSPSSPTEPTDPTP